jgi:hypothetical protein
MIYAERCETFNMTVSPLGSKLQALGTSLFCYMHPDVRVMTAIPKIYNAALYSEGCAAIWHLDFGETSSVREQLESVGTIAVDW